MTAEQQGAGRDDVRGRQGKNTYAASLRSVEEEGTHATHNNLSSYNRGLENRSRISSP